MVVRCLERRVYLLLRLLVHKHVLLLLLLRLLRRRLRLQLQLELRIGAQKLLLVAGRRLRRLGIGQLHGRSDWSGMAVRQLRLLLDG